jgi:hypothetical protein
MELLTLMVETTSHRRALMMVGASVVATMMGAVEWPEMVEALQRVGYSQASVYNLRVDMRRVGVRLAEVEGQEAPSWCELVGRFASLQNSESGLTPAVPVR